jgi:ParB family chromosome partitioning protein
MTEAATITIEQVSLDLIDIDPTNVRADLGELEELAESIKQHGVLQPVTLRPTENGRYAPTIGNRRCAAARLAELETVPAMIREAEPLDLRAELQVIENVHREDLKPSELARAIGYLLGIKDGRKRRYTQQTLAARLGMSQAKVSKYAALANLSDEPLAAIDQDRIGVEDGYELSKLARWPERLAKALEVGLAKGDVPAAVRQQLAAQEREQKRERVLADLRAAKAKIAPEGWARTGVQLGRGNLDASVDTPETHAEEPCHAAVVTSDAEIMWVCLEPQRHTSSPATGGKTDAGSEGSSDAGRTEVDKDAPERQTPDAEDEVDEQAAAEQAERERREAEQREHEEALRVAGHARFAAMRVALERKLNRAMVQRYVSWAYLRGMVLPGYDDTPACELLGIEPDEEGKQETWPILTYAAQGDRELERAVLAVAFTATEEWLRGPWPRFNHPMGAEHYALLAKLGYDLQEIEQDELEQVKAEADTEPESVAETGEEAEEAETPTADSEPITVEG